MSLAKINYFHKYLKYRNKYMMHGGAAQTPSVIYCIDWIRHAESCSNYNNDYTHDIPPGEKFESNTPLATKCKSIFELEPPLSYIGMCQAINLGNMYFNKLPQMHNMFITSPLVRTITTALLALRGHSDITIFIIPFINETDHTDFNMTLSANQDCVIANKLTKPDPRNKIKPTYDRQNRSVPSKILKKKINFIIDWITKNWIQYYDDIELLDNLKILYDKCPPNIQQLIISKSFWETTSHTFTRVKPFNWKQWENLKNTLPLNTKSDITQAIVTFIKTYKLIKKKYNSFPNIDYTKYEQYEREYESTGIDVYESNYTEFSKNILPNLINELYTKPLSKITECPVIGAFVHNGIIKQINSNPDMNTMNTGIVRQSVLDNGMSNFNIQHVPTKIREIYPNLEKHNPNVCAIDNNKIYTKNDVQLMRILNEGTVSSE